MIVVGLAVVIFGGFVYYSNTNIFKHEYEGLGGCP